MKSKSDHPDLVPAVIETTRLFVKADEKSVAHFAGLFDSAYTKDRILVLLRNAAAIIGDSDLAYEGLAGRSELRIEVGEVKNIRPSENNKESLCRMAARWFHCQENFNAFYEVMPDPFRRMWLSACSLTSLTPEKCSEILGRNIMVTTGRGYWRTETVDGNLVPWLVWPHSVYYGVKVPLSLPPEIRPYIFRAVYPPMKLEEMTVDTLPENEKYTLFEDAEGTFKAIPVLVNFCRQGILMNGATKMGVTMARKMHKSLGLREFFPDSVDKDDSVWRTTLLAATVCQIMDGIKSTQSVSAKMVLKKLIEFSPIGKSQSMFFRHLMPHYGWRNNHAIMEGATTLLNAGVKEVLIRIPAGKWVSFKNIIRQIMGDSYQDILFSAFRGGSDAANILNSRSACYVNDFNFKQQFGVPLVQAYLTYLASFGAVELAYNASEPKDPSPMSRLAYVRLTPLGRFLYGLDKSMPHLSGTEENLNFELSDTRLLFRPFSADNPYLTIIKDFARPVGAGRYAVTPESFLAGCNSREDLQDRIDLFHEIVSSEPPQIWEDFFAKMLSNASAFLTHNNPMYIVRVSDDHPELLRIISSDPVLRKFVIRAEQGYLLYPLAKGSEFLERMKQLGYLI
ncbi:MAG: hypothetical protein K2K55_00600 [Duncaniella sp.]|nr:hypothetical protein [Duncaniella sp.]